MLEVENLSKEYPTPRGPLRILEGVSLRLERGEAVAVMGPSGSGKSSLLYVLGALDAPTAGTVRLDGRDPFAMPERELAAFRNREGDAPTAGTVRLDGRDPFAMPERELAAFRNREVGFIFQDHCLLPQLSVLENVLAPTLVAGTTREDAERARALLEEVGLSERLEHRPAELSGGEKQRAALARALIRKPALLLADEPTGNLDQAAAARVASLLAELHRRQETILVVVTHSRELAAHFPVRYELHERKLVKVVNRES